MKYKVPTSVRDVSSLYGLLSYFRQFVPGFAVITSPISRLLREGEELKWTSRHAKLVEEVARQLVEGAELQLPNSMKPFVLEVGASVLGYGGVLL